MLSISEDQPIPRRLWIECVKWRADYACEDCGYAYDPDTPRQHQSRLSAHHIDGDDTNNTLANGKALCSRCHRAAHVALGDKSTAAERSERARRGWETRVRNGNFSSPFADMTPEQMSEKNRKSATNRTDLDRGTDGRYSATPTPAPTPAEDQYGGGP